MTNQLVGEIYKKIIEEVVAGSKDQFEESGVSASVLEDLAKEWRTKLSARNVAVMPWDPKAAPPQAQATTASPLPSAANGLPSYPYDGQAGAVNGSTYIKAEPGAEAQYHGLSNGYSREPPPTQGGFARAQQLVQQQQAQRGLALPGQRPQGLQMPTQSAQQYAQQQQQYNMQRQQQALQQQQAQPRIKVENETPQVNQGSYTQQPRPPTATYAQTDGADDALQQWQSQLAQRRAVTAEQTRRADRMMRDQVLQSSADLQSGLMLPLGEQPGLYDRKRRGTAPIASGSKAQSQPSISQLDGDNDFDDDEAKIKDEDDEDAINSDLDSDEDPTGNIGDEEDDLGDTILCTYDKVQRVKNKWKCTLKDGVMSISGKEWVFHKGMGEFEW
ncbi:hypothetical protein BAUCODRAFT_385117 [Baudoinia panamericana UAMH 10762]|uniref:Uncharacterized protein n=1 Tax=Baudoinia panamericana (strain UAMH 10762) TaxID=717646 RepID=M2MQ72_BAUPA|nr:uncharacterized protein BAUCODRAFT_385117 [Baudoinia panamericana UAMH 10762]EMC98921.1 hypothetical protein BAUCODRAFT_385117 [Baudoinia panamericana UAMH 10762]